MADNAKPRRHAGREPCLIEDCGRPTYIRGLCSRHYDRWHTYGDPLAGGPIRADRGTRFPCTVPDCDGSMVARGYCGMHYQRWAKYGDPLKVHSQGSGRTLPAEVRFRAAVKTGEIPPGFSTPHLLWQRPPNSAGYGTLKVNGRGEMAHRYALALAGVLIPPGYEPDHLCGVKLCVEVTHLKVVTLSENRRRAALAGVRKRRAEMAAMLEQ